MKKQYLGILMTICLLFLSGWSRAASGQETASVPEEEPAVLRPLQITASSELAPYHSAIPPYPLYTYYAPYVDDGDLNTAWNEGADGAGIGEYLDFVFPEGTVLTGILLYPGFYSTEELFYQNNAPTVLKITCGDSTVTISAGTYAEQWQNGFQGMYTDLETPVTCSGPVRVTIEDVRLGNTYNDACISELHFYGCPGAASGPQELPAAEPGSADPGTDSAADISAAQIGDLVPFGTVGSVDGSSALVWQVLDKTEDTLLLITRDVLDAPRYSDSNYYPVWGTSPMRSWLNGEFYQRTFADEEKARIHPTDITYTTTLTETGWGNETVTDLVFLLNADQARQYFADNAARRAAVSGTADGSSATENGTAPWWLIGVGFESQGVMQVTASGEVDTYGISVENHLGVRPVIRVRIAGGTGNTDDTGNAGDTGNADSAGGNTETGGGAALSEDSMRQLFTNTVSGNILYFLYDDYDCNGTYEAFVVTEQPDNPIYARAYFIADNGSITKLTEDRELLGYDFQDNGNVRQRYMADTGTQKFYIWENSAGGSGSLSRVFGVRGSFPYEPQISGHSEAFRQDGDQFVSYESDFSGGFHDYIRTVYTYDPNTGEFLKQ